MAVLTCYRRPGGAVILLTVLILTADCDRGQYKQTFTRTFKDAASKDTLSGLLSKGKGALGPEPQQEQSCSSDGESCRDGDCPAEQESCTSPTEGSPQLDKDGVSPDEKDGVLQDEQFDLSVVNDDDVGIISQLVDIASTGVSTVYRTAKSKVFDTGAKLIKNFSETVRSVIGEELHSFLQASLNSLGASLLTPGATLYALGQTAMTISLILICLLLSYLLLGRILFLGILGLDASVFLLHQFMGPKWIFDWILELCSQCVNIGMYMWEYPKTSSFLLVLLLMYSVLFPLAKWLTQKTPAQKMADMTRCVLDISRRLEMLETRQKEALQEVERKQTEMLEILRRLDPNKN